MFLKFNYQTIAEKIISRIYLTKNVINFFTHNQILVIETM